jgi:hypothetical protein
MDTKSRVSCRARKMLDVQMSQCYLHNNGHTFLCLLVSQRKCRYYSSIHPHGVLYDKSSEGAPYSDGSSSSEKGDDAVAPNATYTYTWKVKVKVLRLVSWLACQCYGGSNTCWTVFFWAIPGAQQKKDGKHTTNWILLVFGLLAHA